MRLFTPAGRLVATYLMTGSSFVGDPYSVTAQADLPTAGVYVLNIATAADAPWSLEIGR